MKDELTVLENLEFSAQLSGLENLRLQSKALEQLGIARLADLPARYLSQGQRRRAALARLALSAAVPLWLLDEPFAALDDEAIAQRERAVRRAPRRRRHAGADFAPGRADRRAGARRTSSCG